MNKAVRSATDLITIARQQLPAAGTPLLLAVSGGMDSMTLWALLHQAGDWPLYLYHLDHGLRPEAKQDVRLIQQTADERSMSKRLVVEHEDIQVLAHRWRCGLEEAGRRQRYYRLSHLAKKIHVCNVVTAHHRSDQTETVLANLLRGASTIGMGGMRTERRLTPSIALRRPWLLVPHQAITQAAEQHGVRWHEDLSNRDLRFTRNFLRHVVLPEWEDHVPGIGEALLAFAEEQQTKAQDLEAWIDQYWHQHHRGQQLSFSGLTTSSPEQRSFLWRYLLLWCTCPLSRHLIRAVEDLYLGLDGRQLHVGHLLFTRGSEQLHWQAAKPEALFSHGKRLQIDQPARAGTWTLHVAEVGPGELDENDPYAACIDADAVSGELMWREPKRGERWLPLGAPGSKTILKYLANRRVPSRQRPHWPVVADAEGVIWIPGFTIAERVRIEAGSQRLLRLRQSQNNRPPLIELDASDF